MEPKRLLKPRIEPVDMSETDGETRSMLELIAERNKGQVFNIFATLARYPKLLKRWLVFANHILSKSSLPPREREILILRTALLCDSEYEWGQHVRIGKALGLSDDVFRQISDGPNASGWNAFDAALVKAVDELHSGAIISDATWKALSKRYNEYQLMDLVFTVGQYHMVAMAINTFGIQLDDGIDGFTVKRGVQDKG